MKNPFNFESRTVNFSLEETIKTLADLAKRKELITAFALGRTINFASQGLLLPWIDRLARGEKNPNAEKLTEALAKASPFVLELLKKDAENIAAGIYPISVLKLESPWRHGLRLPRLYWDAFQVARRRVKGVNKDFSSKSKKENLNLPEYYRRNFHFQTDGYLSEHSAILYEHQVEVLFSGCADAMRRLLLPPMVAHFENQGEGCHFLEIGAGTGRLTRFVALTFPKAKITIVEPSKEYLNYAKSNLKEFSNIFYVEGFAEILFDSQMFKANTFDALYSCFLFHELPFEIREKIFAQSTALLKPGGFLGHVDSIQKGDVDELQWALEQFPKDFHEPFYKNYILNPLTDLFEKYGYKNVQQSTGFFSKAVFASKS